MIETLARYDLIIEVARCDRYLALLTFERMDNTYLKIMVEWPGQARLLGRIIAQDDRYHAYRALDWLDCSEQLEPMLCRLCAEAGLWVVEIMD